MLRTSPLEDFAIMRNRLKSASEFRSNPSAIQIASPYSCCLPFMTFDVPTFDSSGTFPPPVSRILFPNRITPIQATIIHLWMPVAGHLLQPTRELGRAALKHSPIWFCTGWGLHSFPGHPGNWCALTAPFHPYPVPSIRSARGGLLSVALSFALPRLQVMEHPALWCSDFPPDE